MSAEQPANQPENDTIDLRRYLDILRKRKWVILATTALGITASVLYTMRQPKIYQATASVEIEPVAPQIFGSEVQEVVQLGTGSYWSNQEYYNTQIEILKGYDLCLDTVVKNDFQDDERIISKDKAATLKDEDRIEIAADRLCGSISASLSKDSRIVYVSVRDRSPQLARDLVNAHLKRYREQNMERRQVDTVDAKGLLARLLDEGEKSLREAEDALLEFKSKNDVVSVSLEDRLNLVATDLAKYNAAASDARIKRIELGALRDRARAAMDGDVLESPVFGLTDRPRLTGLKEQYLRERQIFLELKERFGAKHPQYMAQKEKVDDSLAEISREAKLAMREIDERYKAVAETERKFQAEAERLHNDAVALGPLTVEYERLKRSREAAAQNHTILLNRYGSSEISASRNQVGNNIKDHTRARTPGTPVLPRMRLNVALAAMLSLFLGLGFALVLEYMDRTIKSTEDVEIAAKAPLLGLIPVVDEISGQPTPEMLRERDLYVFKNPASRAAECARSIRTNILFSGADRELKVITVSSPNPQEGKTTSAIYLGTTMAQSGQRVLLVDTDMRRPRLHKSMGVSRGLGMSNLIIGESAELGSVSYEDVIKTTEIPNLFVLTCGPTPPNPAELLLTKRFAEIIEELRGQFDRVIFDSPPLNAVTDAVVLGRLSDGVIMVVQAGKTVREDLSRNARQLRDVGAHMIGVVLNDLDLSDRRYGSQYYYAYNYSESRGEAEMGSA